MFGIGLPEMIAVSLFIPVSIFLGVDSHRKKIPWETEWTTNDSLYWFLFGFFLWPIAATVYTLKRFRILEERERR